MHAGIRECISPSARGRTCATAATSARLTDRSAASATSPSASTFPAASTRLPEPSRTGATVAPGRNAANAGRTPAARAMSANPAMDVCAARRRVLTSACARALGGMHIGKGAWPHLQRTQLSHAACGGDAGAEQVQRVRERANASQRLEEPARGHVTGAGYARRRVMRGRYAYARACARTRTRSPSRPQRLERRRRAATGICRRHVPHTGYANVGGHTGHAFAHARTHA